MTILFLWLLNWQQKVDYKISASLDITEHTLKINEILTYYNNSPVALDTLYLHLYPNAYRDNNTIFAQESKKMGSYRFLRAKVSERGWINISSIIDKDCDPLVFDIDETIMAVLLKKPLESGDSVVLNIDAILKIPAIFSRLGHKGEHYEMVQWYPKPCVFDQSGWHKEPYHAIGEFYGEFGTFDVTIDLPQEYVVAATGILIDSVPCNDNRKKVRFIAQNVHDFAWVCDPNFEIATEEIDSILIEVYYIKKYGKKWRNASSYAVDAVRRYNRWFGKYPYKKLSVVQGYFGGGMEYPNLVIIGGSEDSFTRQFELVIIHEIAHQWFYGILGSNEMDEAWLDEGFTSYAEARYFVDKYGIDNTFLKLPFLPKLRHNYIQRLTYYIALTNGLEMPVLTKASLFVDAPFAYQVAAYSKPALFLRYLESYLGTSTFNDILKIYFENYKFRHPKSEDFIELCEEVSGVNLRNFFADFLHTTKYCDWRIRKINKNSLIVENKGEFLLPVDIFIETDNGGQVLRVDKPLDTLSFPSAKMIKKVGIDPYDYTPESNRFNNFYPRKFAVKPIFDWPSFDTYQVFFLPYLWYDSDDGFTPGMYLAGAQFIDADFIMGKNQWIFGYIYGLKSKKHYYSFSYQTPLIFKSGYRSRIFTKGSISDDEIEYQLGFINDFGRPFTAKPEINFKTFLSFNDLKSLVYVDSVDWSIAKYYLFQNLFAWRTIHYSMVFYSGGAFKYFNKDWHFTKFTLEIEKTSRLFLPFLYFRFFAGKIWGTSPNQEKLFLSGALRHTFITNLFFGQKGYASPQEHIHIKQDGNMPGYQGMHIKSDGMFSLNFQLPEGFFLRLFCDYGYYYNADSLRWQHAYDAGIKLVLGPISFILPIYIKDQFLPKNWSVELLSVGVGF
ncbi:MAG: M1 family aminopeptidase [bacterium]